MFKKAIGALFGALIGGPAGVIGTVATEIVTNWKSNQENKRQVKKAASEFRQAQARSSQTHKHEWELRALEGADLWTRRLVLAVFMWPLVWAYFDPEGVQTYFNVTLAVLPDWYKQAFLGMLAVVWGLSELRNTRAGREGTS